MRVLKWTPFFDVKEESPIVPIWIYFLNLRLHFFNPKVLHALGSIFGRPLQTDHATMTRTRPSVARVLVEVDISKKHVKEIWVGSKAYGYLQKVEFEKVSDFCHHCKIHDHAVSECFKLHPVLKKSFTSMLEKANLPNKIIINVEDKLHPSSTAVKIGNNGKLVTEFPENYEKVLEDNLFDNANVAMEGEGVIEVNIYVSLESMLHNTSDNQLLVNQENTIPITKIGNASIDTCEEGEFNPETGLETVNEDLLECEEKKDSMSSNVAGAESNNNEEDEFIKVNRKKSKNGKNSVHSTPRSTRAQTSIKGCNG
ncbi:hypothetical protein MA16_Dca012552 [Dendrobium catenatum]|uniref:Uncharacterized protein n=1 Tax=Dendrobium catenatum TaxID=906689 RepID=A0A2I0W557_9ASPA|nr:hypothetical protein MA16_Dca012552 [Dendrobium catenatum]